MKGQIEEQEKNNDNAREAYNKGVNRIRGRLNYAPVNYNHWVGI